MSLPVVIIFEQHWDTIPKSIIKDSLPALSKKGYETFCFEAPHDLSSDEIVAAHNAGLEFDSNIEQKAEKLLKQVNITRKLSDMSFSSLADLMRLHVSSKKYVEVAERIKQAPASRILKEVFGEAKKLSIHLKGIDIERSEFGEMLSFDLTERLPGIKRREELRITTMFQNLLKLRTQQEEGVIFLCGATHAKGLIDEFKKYGLKDEVLYYFPHSLSRYPEQIDLMKGIMDDNSDTLVDHSYVLDQKDIKPFSERISREITGKIRYNGEIHGYNSHSQFLSDFFKTNFRAFRRAGHHVDALVEVVEPSYTEDIQRRLTAVGVQPHTISLDGRSYLVVPNVNTKEIAERIRTLAS